MTSRTTGEMITPPTEMIYKDRLIIKDTCDKIIRCMSQFSKYTQKELMSYDFLDDYEEYEDFEKSTSIPIYSYRNENHLDGLCEVRPNIPDEDYVGNRGSIIILYHYKDDRTCEYDTGWSFPVRRFTKTNNIHHAVYACKLFYQHFCDQKDELGRGAVSQMLKEEYRKEPLFLKRRLRDV